uniref:Uncharacterized protein n=1 Tax=Streptomyces sp. NBC_01393 TaxID=2903851 RepID=A0AAU3HTZ7_9ACTN
MGVLYGYFAAADDDDAVRAVVRDDGEPSGTGYDQLVIKGIDPVVELTPAEALMTGRSAADVRSDPRHGSLVGMLGDGELVVVSLTDTFRDALATCEATSLRDVASDWSSTEGIFYHPADPEDLAGFLERLSELAGRAVSRDARLYCWICP